MKPPGFFCTVSQIEKTIQIGKTVSGDFSFADVLILKLPQGDFRHRFSIGNSFSYGFGNLASFELRYSISGYLRGMKVYSNDYPGFVAGANGLRISTNRTIIVGKPYPSIFPNKNTIREMSVFRGANKFNYYPPHDVTGEIDELRTSYSISNISNLEGFSADLSLFCVSSSTDLDN